MAEISYHACCIVCQGGTPVKLGTISVLTLPTFFCQQFHKTDSFKIKKYPFYDWPFSVSKGSTKSCQIFLIPYARTENYLKEKRTRRISVFNCS